MKHLIVTNVLAGSGFKASLVSKENIDKAFEGLDYEIYLTEGPRSVIPFLRKYLTDHKDETVRVYACGGDGTLHEVVNGVVGFDNAEVALFACGTGNDFTKTFGGAERFRDFSTLIAGEVKGIDLSKVESESLEEPWYSVNVINFGFDAIVGAMGNYYKEHGYPEKAKAKGMSPYDYALKNDAMKHGRFNDTIVYADGVKLNERQILLCTLAQGQYVGGKFHCSPKSDNTDGLIDVCLLKTMSFLGLGLIIGPYTKGQHLNKKRKKVVYTRAKNIKVVAPRDIDLCIDGEMVKGKEFNITSMPAAIKMVFPK